METDDRRRTGNRRAIAVQDRIIQFNGFDDRMLAVRALTVFVDAASPRRHIEHVVTFDRRRKPSKRKHRGLIAILKAGLHKLRYDRTVQFQATHP